MGPGGRGWMTVALIYEELQCQVVKKKTDEAVAFFRKRRTWVSNLNFLITSFL